MNCAGCCRWLFLILGTALSVAATIMIIYGGVSAYNVKASDAASDGVAQYLGEFIRCTDIRDAVPLKNDGTDDDYKKVILYQCEMQRAPLQFLYVITGLIALTTLLVGVATNCCTSTEKKFNSYAFPTMLALSFALCIVSIVVMGSSTSSISSHFLPCDKFDDATIQRLITQDDAVCVTGNGSNNDTALKWLESVVVFYTGNALQMLVVIIFLMINGCCTASQGRRNSLADPLTQPAYNSYGNYA